MKKKKKNKKKQQTNNKQTNKDNIYFPKLFAKHRYNRSVIIN